LPPTLTPWLQKRASNMNFKRYCDWRHTALHRAAGKPLHTTLQHVVARL
jgi:hypothetical protein